MADEKDKEKDEKQPEQKPDEKTEQKSDKKPFYDQNIELDFECKKCQHKEKIVKRVYSVKKVIEPAVAAEVEIVTRCETVKTLNDFTEKKDEEPKKTPDKKGEKEPTGILDSVLN